MYAIQFMKESMFMNKYFTVDELRKMAQLTGALLMTAILSGCRGSQEIDDVQETAIAENKTIEVTTVSENEIEFKVDSNEVVDIDSFVEIYLQEYTAELTGDDESEIIQLRVLGEKDDDISDIEELVATHARRISVQVMDGKQKDQILYSKMFSNTHMENGQLSLVQKDGKDYLMESNMSQQMGGGNYSYQVFDFSDGVQQVIAEDRVVFAISQEMVERMVQSGECVYFREDVVPSLREGMEQWIDDAILLVGCDVNDYYYGNRQVYFSYGENRYQLQEYLNGVWTRVDEEMQIHEQEPLQYIYNISHDHSFYETFGVEEFYTLQQTYQVRINHDVDSSTDMTAKNDKVEVYTGNVGDGDSGIVLVYSGDGANEPYSIEAHTARAGWTNIYLISKEDKDYLLELQLDIRGGFGELRYVVYAFGEQAGPNLAVWVEDGMFYAYENESFDEATFMEWADNMEKWLEQAELLLSTQDGEVRVESVNDMERYGAEKLLEMIQQSCEG